MESGYKVYDVMTSNPIIITKDATVQQAANLMAEHRVASLVIKENEKFLGLITEREITRKLAASNLSSAETKVEDIMMTSIATTLPTEDVTTALKKLSDLGQKQMPVVDNSGQLVGLMTFKDIMRVQPQLFGMIYEKYNIREAERKPIHAMKDNEGLCTVCGNYSFNLKDSDDSESLCPDCHSVF